MLDKLLFAFLLVMCLIVGGTFLVDEAPNSYGVDHAEFADMKQGGSGSLRHGDIVWMGLLFGALQIMFFVGCLKMGLNDQCRSKTPFLLGGLAYVAILSAIVLADRQYAQSSDFTLVLSFPLPTSIFLFGLYTAPLIFTSIYVVFFNRWILSSADLEQFREKLKGMKQSEMDS